MSAYIWVDHLFQFSSLSIRKSEKQVDNDNCLDNGMWLKAWYKKKGSFINGLLALSWKRKNAYFRQIQISLECIVTQRNAPNKNIKCQKYNQSPDNNLLLQKQHSGEPQEAWKTASLQHLAKRCAWMSEVYFQKCQYFVLRNVV